jgi:hypothetical protein
VFKVGVINIEGYFGPGGGAYLWWREGAEEIRDTSKF